MSKTERTDASPAEEPPAAEPLPWATRWKHRARQLRNEASVHLVRGAATAVGGGIVFYASTWISVR
ncbi:hypothetical protein ACIRUY_17115 [Streptomyces erythrochromogenes]|uniref:hypothetical protein n=1 Tax=Streptomyces erythrochromogenes TaxID=285574 RepID=UPI00380E0764